MKYVVKSPKSYLKSPLSASAGTVVLRSFQDSKGNNLVMSDFGDFGVIVIKQGSTIEMIKFSGISTAADDTATLTVASSGRNIDPTEPYAGYATGNTFQAGAEVIVTNDPLSMAQFGNLNVANTWALLQIFTTVPQTTGGNPINANDLARKAYVDSVVAGIATTVNVVVPGTAGETVSAGNLVYFDDTDNEWKLCDADTATTVENVMLGVAQGAGTNGNTISGGVLLRGLDANQSGLTAGAIYYAGNTGGAISSSAGTKEVTVGFAYSTTQLYFNPRFNQQLTENQQDLIEKFELGTDWYAAANSGTDSYAITLAPAPTAYATGMRIRFRTDVANTGACSLNVNGLGARDIKKHNDQDLETGDLEANMIVEVVYDGLSGQFKMVSQTAQNPIAGSVVSLTAGEDIAQYDAVCIGNAEQAALYTQGSEDTSEQVNTTAIWFAQKFTTNADTISIKSITAYFVRSGASPLSHTLTASVRADSAGLPTGADLGSDSGSGTIDVSGGGDAITVTFTTPITVSPSTDYHIVLRVTNPDADLYIRRLNSASQGTSKSTNSGSSWSANNGALHLIVNDIDTVAGQIYKADASLNDVHANNFIGFANEAITSGQAGSVTVSGLVTLTGLTAGAQYFLSDTDGAIATTAGTVSRKVGNAISTTKLLIKHDNA